MHQVCAAASGCHTGLLQRTSPPAGKSICFAAAAAGMLPQGTGLLAGVWWWGWGGRRAVHRRPSIARAGRVGAKDESLGLTPAVRMLSGGRRGSSLPPFCLKLAWYWRASLFAGFRCCNLTSPRALALLVPLRLWSSGSSAVGRVCQPVGFKSSSRCISNK